MCANSTFTLHVLCIKLAHDAKQLRRLVVENFITVSFIPYLVEKKFYGLKPPDFWAKVYRPPLCQQACVNMVTQM